MSKYQFTNLNWPINNFQMLQKNVKTFQNPIEAPKYLATDYKTA